MKKENKDYIVLLNDFLHLQEKATELRKENIELKEKLRIISIGQPWLGDHFNVDGVQEYQRLKDKLKVLSEELSNTKAFSTKAMEEKCALCPNDIPVSAYMDAVNTIKKTAEILRDLNKHANITNIDDIVLYLEEKYEELHMNKEE